MPECVLLIISYTVYIFDGLSAMRQAQLPGGWVRNTVVIDGLIF